MARYVFVSTISVYSDFSKPGLQENAPLAVTDNPTIEEITSESYGPLKALCEEKVREYFPGNHLIVRPGVIVGPHDPTDRFTYWAHRVFEGGSILAPAPPDRVLQFIDARDLAAWTIRMTETKQNGTFNATGPEKRLTFEDLFRECRKASGNEAKFVWVDEGFLEEKEVTVWKDLPFWLPGEKFAGIMHIDCTKAISAGLNFRPLIDTVRDTIRWVSSRALAAEWNAGLDSERESKLLREWQRRSKKGN